jgi:hypothetical protein
MGFSERLHCEITVNCYLPNVLEATIWSNKAYILAHFGGKRAANLLPGAPVNAFRTPNRL